MAYALKIKKGGMFLALSVCFFALSALTYSISNKDRAEKIIVINGHALDVDIADEIIEQAQGLSGREDLCNECGMLFVFPAKQIRHFWMKNMNFPLDIIWISDGKIANISYDLTPEGERPERTYSSLEPANYVLEVNAGWAEKHRVKIGQDVLINL